MSFTGLLCAHEESCLSSLEDHEGNSEVSLSAPGCAFIEAAFLSRRRFQLHVCLVTDTSRKAGNGVLDRTLI